MAKFHINGNGEAGTCRAEKGNCPFGGESEHFTTAEAARNAFEETMSNQTVSGLSKKSAPTKKKFERKPARLGQPDGVVQLDETLRKWTSQRAGIRSIQSAKLLSAAARLKARFDDPKLDSFALAEKMMKEYREEVKGAGFIEETAYAMDEGAFSYISPTVGGAAREFENTLVRAGWETRGSNDSLEFAKLFAQSAKHVGPKAGAEKLAEEFKNQAKKAGWDTSGMDEDGALAEASRKATYYVRMDKEAYKDELNAIA